MVKSLLQRIPDTSLHGHVQFAGEAKGNARYDKSLKNDSTQTLGTTEYDLAQSRVQLLFDVPWGICASQPLN